MDPMNQKEWLRLIEHSRNSRCKLNNNKKQPGLFSVLSNSKKRKENSPLSSLSSSLSSSSLPLFLNTPCPGLYSEQINSYINRTLSIYGVAQQHELVGKEIFSNKFQNNMKFDSKQLNKEEILQFNQQMIIESEWFIDHFEMCIRSVVKKTYGQVCSPCYLLYNNLYFLNCIRAVTPEPKNIKYIPKFYYNNNSLLSYLKNNYIKQLHNILYNENSFLKDFWAKFSEKATEGIFEQKPVFKGLFYIMLQATEYENQNKGLQNLKYSNEFINFLVILESISLKALDLFCQNLAEPDYIYIKEEGESRPLIKNNQVIDITALRRYRRILDNGPVVAMTNCTKIKAGLQYSLSLGCIVGSTLNYNHYKIETYNEYNKVSDIKQKNAVAKYVRAYVLQIPLPKFLPIIVALIPNRSDNNSAAAEFQA
ncbi:hypothetical protein C2G38_2225512 [Gigaspora rosea]|uniref:Uncharacterized protein n=1 Tax=Gigaspora rosea TaxID=44941 RepID=A0A397U847_9GLOM|nr:hypothetical protein C2G38_2225512 [Gigaspora rosea]